MLDRKGIVKEDIMKKRLLVILLSVAVLFTFTPTIALAETEASVRGSGEEEVIATPATTGWYTDGDYYYYYDAAGNMMTGWKKIGGYWYYFAPEDNFESGTGYVYDKGQMVECGITGINGKWYYFGPWPGYATGGTDAKWGKLQYGWIKETYDSDVYWYYGDPDKDGQLALGWKKINGKWYYFEKSDAGENGFEFAQMYAEGIYRINGKLYYFDKSGAMRTGWIKESGSETMDDGGVYPYVDWYYSDPAGDGELTVGWKKINGKWYYFETEYGTMVGNCTEEIGGKLYAFNRDGSLHDKAGWADLYEEWYDPNGKKVKESWWVYTNSNGIATTGWKKISGVWYHFSEYGYMSASAWIKDSKGWMYVGANGGMVTSNWVKSGGKWYYMKADGYMAASQWLKLGADWYYVDGNGVMVTGTVTIGGKQYTFNSSGKWIK